MGCKGISLKPWVLYSQGASAQSSGVGASTALVYDTSNFSDARLRLNTICVGIKDNNVFVFSNTGSNITYSFADIPVTNAGVTTLTPVGGMTGIPEPTVLPGPEFRGNTLSEMGFNIGGYQGNATGFKVIKICDSTNTKVYYLTLTGWWIGVAYQTPSRIVLTLQQMSP